TGDGAPDEARVDLPQPALAEPEALHRAGAEVLDQDVRALRQRPRQLEVLPRVQVEHDAALVAVDRLEVRGGAVRRPRRPPGAGVVALRALDLDRGSADIAE